MVNISQETTEEINTRLRSVIKEASLKVYEETYCFQEFPLVSFPSMASSEALALVRDDRVWSQLIMYTGGPEEKFGLFRFHFPAGADTSGFVGWLATHLKLKFGTGVFVVCGQNSQRGGIFDYWGFPIELATQVIAEVRSLSEQ
jgi:hypothetical protein